MVFSFQCGCKKCTFCELTRTLTPISCQCPTKVRGEHNHCTFPLALDLELIDKAARLQMRRDLDSLDELITQGERVAAAAAVVHGARTETLGEAAAENVGSDFTKGATE